MFKSEAKSFDSNTQAPTTASTVESRGLSGLLSDAGERERARRWPSNSQVEGTCEQREPFPEHHPNHRPGGPTADRYRRAERPEGARGERSEQEPFANSKRAKCSKAAPEKWQHIGSKRRKSVSANEPFAKQLQRKNRRRWTHKKDGGAQVFPLLLWGWGGGNRSRLRAKYSTPNYGIWCDNEAQSAGLNSPANSGLPAGEIQAEVTQTSCPSLTGLQKGRANSFAGCCGWVAVIQATSTANGAARGRGLSESSDQKNDKAQRAFVAETHEGRATKLPRSFIERDHLGGGVARGGDWPC